MRKSGPRSLSPSAGTNFTVLTLRLRVLTVPVKPFSVLVKVPMVAIVVFLFPIGPRQSRPRWWSFDRGRSDRTRRAQRQRLTAADGFFASRCKARHARRKKSWRRLLREDDRGEAGLRSDPIHSRPRGGRRRWKLSGIRQATTAFHKQRRQHRVGPNRLPLNGRVFGQRFSWRHLGPLTPYLRDAIVGDAEEGRP